MNRSIRQGDIYREKERMIGSKRTWKEMVRKKEKDMERNRILDREGREKQRAESREHYFYNEPLHLPG